MQNTGIFTTCNNGRVGMLRIIFSEIAIKNTGYFIFIHPFFRLFHCHFMRFNGNIDGILHVLARDIKTGNEKLVEMASAVEVDDAEVQQMIEESVEHAFDDIEERRWIEAKLRAEQTLTATRKGLESLGGELADDQRGAIESALAAVESLLAKRGRDEAVTAAELKEANGNLDDATQPLAELMMDRVMAEMLEKRGVLPG